jgi:predicted  nucleic acid-binding Zn-ribbon protein
MLPPALEKLLILQDREMKRTTLDGQLKAIPAEIASVERTIASEKAAIDAARTEWRELESRKKLLETEIGSAEQRVATYRTQQLAVRKNDEYQALGHQIETTRAEIGELEAKELAVMYEIDAAKKRFADAELVLKQNIAGNEARIANYHHKTASLAEELKGVRTEVERARAEVEPASLRVFDRMLYRGLPVVVPVRGGKCGGCHLKVSNEAESASRGSTAGKEMATCDQCGRIVYWERE